MEVYQFFIIIAILAYIRQSYGATLGTSTVPNVDFYSHDHGNHHLHDRSYQDSAEHHPLISKVFPRNVEAEDEFEEDFPNYPSAEIRKFLESNPILRDYFISVPVVPQIGNRNSEPSDEDQEQVMCRTMQQKVIRPRRLKNVLGMEKTVVNIKGEYEQGIEIKRCISDGRTCENTSLPLGYVSYCSQEYITRELMVYNSTTAFDLFKFPSCCVCKIKRG